MKTGWEAKLEFACIWLKLLCLLFWLSLPWNGCLCLETFRARSAIYIGEHHVPAKKIVSRTFVENLMSRRLNHSNPILLQLFLFIFVRFEYTRPSFPVPRYSALSKLAFYSFIFTFCSVLIVLSFCFQSDFLFSGAKCLAVLWAEFNIHT